MKGAEIRYVNPAVTLRMNGESFARSNYAKEKTRIPKVCEFEPNWVYTCACLHSNEDLRLHLSVLCLLISIDITSLYDCFDSGRITIIHARCTNISKISRPVLKSISGASASKRELQQC